MNQTKNENQKSLGKVKVKSPEQAKETNEASSNVWDLWRYGKSGFITLVKK